MPSRSRSASDCTISFEVPRSSFPSPMEDTSSSMPKVPWTPFMRSWPVAWNRYKAMSALKWVFFAGLVGYVGVLALMYFAQRSLMYFPERVRTPPAAAGLPQAQEVVLQTGDGEKVIAWHVPPRGEKPVVLYFHGNGGALALRASRFRALVADGTGLLALSYRGYGGSSGNPTESGLILDAEAVYRFAAARYPA